MVGRPAPSGASVLDHDDREVVRPEVDPLGEEVGEAAVEGTFGVAGAPLREGDANEDEAVVAVDLEVVAIEPQRCGEYSVTIWNRSRGGTFSCSTSAS